MSRLKEKVETTAGRTYKLWEGEKKGEFVTIEGKQGHFNKDHYNGALGQRKPKQNDVSVPDPRGNGNIYVNQTDAERMGRAANYSSPNVELNPEDVITLESVEENYTAEEIRNAYDREADNATNDIIRYIGGGT